jgi:hypothetical protein
VENFTRLRLSQFRERRFDPREYWSLSELREYTLCLGQMLNCKRWLFLGPVQQAEKHFRLTGKEPVRVVLGVIRVKRHQSANA